MDVTIAAEVAGRVTDEPTSPEALAILTNAHKARARVTLRCPRCDLVIDEARVAHYDGPHAGCCLGDAGKVAHYEVVTSIADRGVTSARVEGMRWTGVNSDKAEARTGRRPTTSDAFRFSRDHQETRYVTRRVDGVEVGTRLRFECKCGAAPDVTRAVLTRRFLAAYLSGLRRIALP